MRCLIVDDNNDFLRAARELLESDGISVVGAVSTGAQAYRTCRDLNPDVVLLDIDLGEENGFDVARQLADATQRVILISGYSRDDFEDMITDSPVLSFLPKASLSGTAIRDILARAGDAVTNRPPPDSE